MSINEKLGINQDAWSGSFVALISAISLSLCISAIAWPIAWYNAEYYKYMTENGYEEQPIGMTGKTSLVKKAK